MAEPPPPPAFRPGERFGDLLIERELGRGAFAVVYLAQDVLLERKVALKVLAPSSLSRAPKERDAFLAEARMVAGLEDPHVVPLYRIHDLGPGGFAFEMEFMVGGSLAASLDEGKKLPTVEVRALLSGVLSGLRSAHAKGIIHRDVKPENLLLGARGDVKLADFGLGRHTGESSLSAEGTTRIVGTPLYMAPEVVMGEAATPACDLWSVGVLAFLLLEGCHPFDASNLPALFYAIHSEEPRPLSPGHPPDLVRLVEHCLQKDPAKRRQSAAELLADLDHGGTRPLGGRPGPAAASGARSRRGAASDPGLIGREAETARIDSLFDAATQGRSGALLLLGDAGVGKSSLLLEAQRTAAARGMRWIQAALTPLGGLQRPLVSAIRHELRGDGGDGPLAGRLTPDRFGGATLALRGLLQEDGYEVEGRQQLIWLLESLLKGLGRERPVVLAIEDLHLGDLDDARVVAELVRRLGDARVCLLVTCRTGDKSTSAVLHASASALAELARAPGVEAVTVPPLSSAAIVRILNRAGDGARPAPDVAQRVLELAEGNPLFALELFRHLLESGAIERHGDTLERTAGFLEAELPARLHELISLRLAALSEEQRTLLDGAAVDGITFQGGALAAVLGTPLLQVLRDLQRIHREHGLVTPLKQGYRFAHALIQDVIVRELAPDLRRSLHAALAEHLERTPRGADDPERLGVHWEEAGDAARASPYLRRAALAAARGQQFLRALDLARRSGALATEASPSVAPSDADLLFALAGCLSDLGRTPEAQVLVGRVLAAADAVGDGVLALRARVWACDFRILTEGVQAIDGGDLERAARDLPPGLEAGRARYLLGYVLRTRGDLSGAERWFREAEAAFESTGPAYMRAQVIHMLGSLAKSRGDLPAAEALFEKAVALKIGLGRRTDAAVSQIMRCMSAFEMGRFDGVSEGLRAAVEDLEISGARERAAHASVYLANVLIAEGSFREAAELCRAALTVLRGDRALYGRMEALTASGECLAALGQTELADRHLAEAATLAESGQDASARTLIEALRARAATLACKHQAARGHAEEASRRAALLAVPRIGAATSLLLAMAGLHGLSLTGLPQPALAEESPRTAAEREATLAALLWRAALTLAEPRPDADILRQARAALSDDAIAGHRAELRLLALKVRAVAPGATAADLAGWYDERARLGFTDRGGGSDTPA